MSEPPVTGIVAAFDVDGTLTTRDCVVPFLVRAAGRRRIILGLLRSPGPLVRALARRDRDALKALAVRCLAGRSTDEIAQLGERFAAEVASDHLRADTPARLAWHVEQGHHVVLVSASLRPYLDPLARLLGAHAVLCCELETADGRYSGRLDGPNCRAAEKVVRLRRHLGGGPTELWAYGDSAGDEQLLAAATHALMVRGTTVTRTPAEETR